MHPDKVWIGTVVTVYTLAIVMGSFRLIYRHRTKQYYWDDWGVAGCVIFNLIIFAMLYMQREDVKETREVQFWLLWFCVPSSILASRLSIAFSVLRLVKFGIWRKRLTIAIIAVFTLAWTVNLVDRLVECNLKTPHQPDCSTSVPDITLFTVCIIADACLLYIPLHLLRNLRQPRGTRFMILVTFSAAGISTVTTVVNTITEFYEGPGYQILERFISNLKAPIALIACSLVVIVPCVYRLFKREEDRMVSITVNIDVSDAGPAAPSVVSLPERVLVRNTPTRSFPEYRFRFHVGALQNEGNVNGHTATV